MRLLSIVAALFLLAGCGNTTSGACNHCPNFKALNSQACTDYWKDKGCKSFGVQEVTDTACGAGQPAQTHLACVWEDCGLEEPKFSCDDFADAF